MKTNPYNFRKKYYSLHKGRVTRIWLTLAAFLITVLLVAIGCINPTKPINEAPKQEEIYTITIEECEYIQYYSVLRYGDSGTKYKAVFITHKGNCKNPIHDGE